MLPQPLDSQPHLGKQALPNPVVAVRNKLGGALENRRPGILVPLVRDHKRNASQSLEHLSALVETHHRGTLVAGRELVRVQTDDHIPDLGNLAQKPDMPIVEQVERSANIHPHR